MKNKLKKEGVFFQELYNSNIWTNKWTVLYAQTVFEFGYENSYSIQLELYWSIHTSYGRLQRPFSSWILLKSWICFMCSFLASCPSINLLWTFFLILIQFIAWKPGHVFNQTSSKEYQDKQRVTHHRGMSHAAYQGLSKPTWQPAPSWKSVPEIMKPLQIHCKITLHRN